MKKHILLSLALMALLTLSFGFVKAQDSETEPDTEQQGESINTEETEQTVPEDEWPRLFQVNSETVINARSAPSTTANVAGVLQPGGIVEVLDSVEGSLVSGNSIWYQIEIAGQDAYVHSSLLVPTSSLPNQNVILDLPNIFLPTVIVNTVGKVSVDPNLAIVQVGFEHIGTEAASVYANTQIAQDSVISALIDIGVPLDDIDATLITIANEDVVVSDGGITGEFVFRAEALLTVYIEDFDTVQEIVETALGNGANSVENIAYTLDSFEQAENQARQAGIQRALELARNIAIESQVVLGPAVTTTVSAFEVSSLRDRSVVNPDVNPITRTPRQPEQLVVSVNVTVEYGILVR